MRSGAPALAALALAGCIPAGSPPAPTARVQQARIADPVPLLDTLFDERPVWDIRPVVANAIETPAGRFHKVASGETGIAIARAYGVDWSRIVALNGIQPPYTIRIGQRLALPPTASTPSQTIEARAAAFSLDIDDILTGGEPASSIEAGGLRALVSPLPAGVALGEPSSFTGGFIWPASGKIVQRFGIVGEGVDSRGIDIGVARSAPIYAAGDGVVAFVGDKVAQYGGLILIKHGDGWMTAYGRVAKADVTRGQSVKRGQLVGRAGKGATPQLFFQMRKNSVAVDPQKQLPPR